MCRILPVIDDPDFVSLLETITWIELGSWAGGEELVGNVACPLAFVFPLPVRPEFGPDPDLKFTGWFTAGAALASNPFGVAVVGAPTGFGGGFGESSPPSPTMALVAVRSSD